MTKPSRKGIGGRKDKLTPLVQESVVRYLRAGNYCDTAAICSGISEGTFWNWMKRGEEEGSGKYFEFMQAVKRAENEAEAEAVAQVRLHAREQWAAGMTWLERKLPGKWGRNDRVEHNAEIKVVIEREEKKADGPDES